MKAAFLVAFLLFLLHNTAEDVLWGNRLIDPIFPALPETSMFPPTKLFLHFETGKHYRTAVWNKSFVKYHAYFISTFFKTLIHLYCILHAHGGPVRCRWLAELYKTTILWGENITLIVSFQPFILNSKQYVSLY